MSEEEAIALLDAIDGSDPEDAHCKADNIVQALLPDEVFEAYDRLVERCDWWPCA